MVTMLIVIYVGGWLAATFAAFAASKRLNDRSSPATHPLMISLAASAIWPLLVVGLVEMSSIVLFTKVESKPGSGTGIVA
jgi:hypothetical protein